MIFMCFFILGIYQYIINEYDHKLVEIFHEYFIHQVHKVRLVSPNDKTKNSYNPYLVVKAVFGTSSARIFS
jgi:hypothetical protein